MAGATIGDRMRVKRLSMHMTQGDVASRLHVTRATYSRYETGEIRDIPLATINSISVILDCTNEYLLGWNEAEEDPVITEGKTRANGTEDILVRGIRKMTDEQRGELLKFAKYMWPGAFSAD